MRKPTAKLHALPERRPPGLPQAETTPLLWQAHTKLELAAKLAAEAADEVAALASAALIAEVRAQAESLDLNAQKLLIGTVSALEVA